ncbi:carboxymuconolactone decarboxylase family protein [Microbacterium sp. I2]|jgi:AhpD family alkylhydroperoxidase|uniref:carboxymuconolactone decarboxylase family protein n=1 Tax=Microbacterium sp. I2 TaxID=3391826 RepID=UPI003EDAD719|nr:carboxymuconolactone decarboxylase family protein [Microbacterium sp.]
MGHINIGKEYPEVYRAMERFSVQAAAAAEQAGLEGRLVELVKLRASQINGCAYCLRLHARDATALGETPERLAVLAAWWESQYFSPQERATLQIVEQVTLISDRNPMPDRGADLAALSDSQIAAVTWLSVAINAWNRVAISSHYPVAPGH